MICSGLRNPPENLSGNESQEQNASSTSPLVDDIRGHQRDIEDFIAAIKNNGMPACDGHEGRRSLDLIERIYQASQKTQTAL